MVLGIICLTLSRTLLDLKVEYSSVCANSLGKTCSVEFTLDKEFKGPLYFYYSLTRFYQNHRLMFYSKHDEQLLGKCLTIDEVDSCDAIKQNKDISRKQSIGNNFLPQEEVVFPCGGLPKSVFTDNFKLFKLNDGSNNGPSYEILLSPKDIAYPGDLRKFKNLPGASKLQSQWMDITDERFIVWMRVAPTSRLKKLWARVGRSSLEKGRYRVQIENNWDGGRYKAEKAIHIAQVNALGGNNMVFGVSFIAVGSIALFAVMLLSVRRFIRPKGILSSHLRTLKKVNNSEF